MCQPESGHIGLKHVVHLIKYLLILITYVICASLNSLYILDHLMDFHEIRYEFLKFVKQTFFRKNWLSGRHLISDVNGYLPVLFILVNRPG